jgi:hypothetical protein
MNWYDKAAQHGDLQLVGFGVVVEATSHGKDRWTRSMTTRSSPLIAKRLRTDKARCCIKPVSFTDLLLLPVVSNTMSTVLTGT